LPTEVVLALNEVARRAGDYNTYLEDLAVTPAADIGYARMIIYGPRGRLIRPIKHPSLQCRSADWS
jgi:hypothetical protein